MTHQRGKRRIAQNYVRARDVATNQRMSSRKISKTWAQRAYPLADQNTLDNLVVERFREGHGNEELQKHLCLYPSNGLQDLIGACVRFETHIEIGTHARKSNEGLYTVQSTTKSEPTLEEVTRAAHRLGFRFTPMDSTPTKSQGIQ